MKLSRQQLIGITIWWSEGTKSRRDVRWKNAVTYPVEVTNTNPVLMKVFLNFLREDIGIDESKLRVQIQVHEGDDVEELEKYWSNICGVDRTFFNKTIVRPIGNKAGKSKGTCKVRFSDKSTYIKLQELLTKALQDLHPYPHLAIQLYDPSKTSSNLLE